MLCICLNNVSVCDLAVIPLLSVAHYGAHYERVAKFRLSAPVTGFQIRKEGAGKRTRHVLPLLRQVM